MPPINRMPRGYSSAPSQGRPREQSIYIGIVKDVSDAQRMGRLAVWIPELCGNPTDPASWIIVSYASPFAGATDYKLLKDNSVTMDGSQQSYGMWAVPPDLDNEVLVCFVNGDYARGFWFACVWQQNMNHMVPGIASDVPSDDPNSNWSNAGSLPPVVEYNKTNTTNPERPARPTFTPLANGLIVEGVRKDFERGPSSTSARREAPSKVFGMLTPRGNTTHIDDNPDNEFIRMRTRSGVQVLIHETTGYIYLNSKLGNSWVEISDSGVDIYSLNAVSVRSQTDINLRADRNIVLDAGANIFMSSGADIRLNAGANYALFATTDLIEQVGGKATLTVAGDRLLVADNIRSQASGDTTSKSAGQNLRDAPTISDNGGGSPSVSANPAAQPEAVGQPDVVVGSGVTKATLTQTIVSRMPSHEPWPGHPTRDQPIPMGSGGTIVPSEPAYPGTSSGGATMVPTGDGQTVTTTEQPMQQCPSGVAKAASLSNEQFQGLQEGSQKTGIPLATLLAIGDVESGHYDRSFYLTATHSAKGMMQFEPATWRGMVSQYGAQDSVTMGDILDDRASGVMGARYCAYLKKVLQGYGIADPTGGQIYCAYNVGQGNFRALNNASGSSNIIAASVITPGYARSNRQFYYGPNGQPFTPAEALAAYENKIGSLEQAYAGQQGLPPPCDRSSNSNAAVAANGTSSGIWVSSSGITTNSSGVAQTTVSNATGAVIVPACGAQYDGQVVDNGQCARFIQVAAPQVGNTSGWQAGAQVVGNTAIVPGTVIMTANAGGNYTNATNGTAHVAIYLSATAGGGIQVRDQWKGKAVGTRVINTVSSLPVDNANYYYILTSPTSRTAGGSGSAPPAPPAPSAPPQGGAIGT